MRRHLPADGNPQSPVRRGVRDPAHQIENRRMQRLIEIGDRLVSTVDRQGVLDQIVGADGEEVDLAGQAIGDERRRRHLHHHSQRDIGIARHAPGLEIALHVTQDGAGAAHLPDIADHGQQHADLAVRRRPQDAAQLRAEQVLVLQAEADAPESQHGIALASFQDRREILLAAQIQSPDHDLVRQGHLGELAVGPIVLLLARQAGRLSQVEELGPVQADPLRAKPSRRQHLLRQLDVGHQAHAQAVASRRRPVAQDRQLELATRLQSSPLMPRRRLVLGGVVQHQPVASVQRQEVAAVHARAGVPEPGDGGNSEGAGDDGRVRGRPASVDRQPDDVLAIQPRRVRGGQRGADDDHVIRQLGEIVPPLAAAQQRLDPGRHVLDVGPPLPELLVSQLREDLGVSADDGVKGPLGVDALPSDEARRLLVERPVLQDQDLDLEDPPVRFPGLPANPVAHLAQLAHRAPHGATETQDLALGFLGREVETEDRDVRPLQDQGPADGDPRGHTDAAHRPAAVAFPRPGRHRSSPKRACTRSTSALSASRSSPPSTLRARRVPWEATSARIPRIDLPSAVRVP